MHHSSSGYKKFHRDSSLCYLSIVDPHGGFGFDVQTLETATVADLKKVVEHAFVQRLKEEERVLISCYCTAEVLLSDLFQAKYGHAGLMYGVISACVFKLYEGGVSAVNKSGALNPQLIISPFVSSSLADSMLRLSNV
ncbi:hypothetical protein Scep_029480 [Stephania cephalantha]|uniref:Uncharacterized protein n=1 Tax=Stephania cephalantha TaxID=152367 RepID=A0AAP0HDK2_9MAGN